MSDPYAANVALLVHFDGSNGSTSFTDAAGRHGLTAGNGGAGAAALGTSRPQFGTAAAELTVGGTTGPYIDVSGNLTDFDLGSSDFTIEGWLQWDGRASGWTTATLLSFRNASGGSGAADLSFFVGINGSNSLVGRCYFGASQARADTTASVNDGATHAWCFMRSGGNLYIFLDGVPGSFSGSISTNSLNAFGSGGQLRIGTGGALYNDGYKGMLDEIRITPGVARYSTSGYTPDTAALDDPAGAGATCVATGFSSIGFGTPVAAATFTGQASGFASSQFGTPAIVTRCQARSFISLAFGIPSTPTNRSARASGFTSLQFGNALAFRYSPGSLGRVCLAEGFHSFAAGTPSAISSVVAQATGFQSFAVGTPASKVTFRCEATGFSSGTTFGTPTVLQRGHASGFASVDFGQATVRRIQQASSIPPRTRFGTPTYTRGANTHFAYGINAGARFGHARVMSSTPRHATGFASCAFGTASAKVVQRASSIVSTPRFGQALAVRNPRC